MLAVQWGSRLGRTVSGSRATAESMRGRSGTCCRLRRKLRGRPGQLGPLRHRTHRPVGSMLVGEKLSRHG